MKTLFPMCPKEPPAQVQAVLLYLRSRIADEDLGDLRVLYHRWYNCREQGYIVTVQKDYRSAPLNILFYEHRNADIICFWKWEHSYFYPPSTWEEVNRGLKPEPLTSKYNYHHEVGCDECREAAEWIMAQILEFAAKEEVLA